MTPLPKPAAGLAFEAVTFARTDAHGTETVILDELTAHFAAGQITLITGPNGAGKTTLLQLLAGVFRPTAGVVRADGEPVSRWVATHRDLWRRKLGMAFQTAQLLAGLTVAENVMVRGVPGARDLATLREEVRTALELLEIDGLAARSLGELSGGERQRVGLARALLGAPRYLLLDEPTAHQDDSGVRCVVDAIVAAAHRDATVVVTCHDRRLSDASPDDSQHLRLEGGSLQREGER